MQDIVIDLMEPDRLAVDMGWASSRVKEIPGSRFTTEDGWSVPRSWAAAVEIGMLAAATGGRVTPTEGAAMWAKDVAGQAETLEGLAGDLGAGTGTGMYFGHQKAGAGWLAAPTPAFPGRLLLDETGAGKTRTVIDALGTIDQWPVLVVTLNTVKEAWRQEFEKVRPDLKVTVMGGSATQRRKQFEQFVAEDGHVLILNYESVRLHSRMSAYPGQALKRCHHGCGGPVGDTGDLKPAQCETHDKELNRHWAVVVADEAHRLKNPKAKQTQAMWGVTRTADRRWALTGTPVANTPDDLWSILRFVDRHTWPVKTKWIDLYCQTGYNWFGGLEITGLKPESQATWDRWWNPIHRRVLKEQVLDLPPLMRGGTLVRRVAMKPDQARAYSEMAESMMTEVRGGTLVAANVLVRANRLTTMASASGKLVGANGEFTLTTPSNKVETFIADYKDGDFPGSTVVGMSSRQLLLLLAAELEKVKIPFVSLHGEIPAPARAVAIEKFQKGEVPLLLMTFATGGTGITLTKASQMVLLQRDWSAVAMKQAIDRVHRIGSEIHDTVTVHDYVSPGTIEEWQLTRLGEKEDVLQEVVRDASRLAAILKGDVA